jgi:hypothetical protein
MYVTLSEFAEYATRFGATLPDGDSERMVLLERASQYIDSIDDKLIGMRTERDQEHAYPRRNLVINGFAFESDYVPTIVKQVQMALAIDMMSGAVAFTEANNVQVTREKVGPIEVAYGKIGGADLSFSPTESSLSYTLLRQLMRPAFGFGSIPLTRV